MSQRIDVRELGSREYAVRVTEGQETTHHRVVVSADVLEDLLVDEEDAAAVVRESVAFLLDRLTAEEIPEDFRLADLVEEHEDYLEEMRSRLS